MHKLRRKFFIQRFIQKFQEKFVHCAEANFTKKYWFIHNLFTNSAPSAVRGTPLYHKNRRLSRDFLWIFCKQFMNTNVTKIGNLLCADCLKEIISYFLLILKCNCYHCMKIWFLFLFLYWYLNSAKHQRTHVLFLLKCVICHYQLCVLL